MDTAQVLFGLLAGAFAAGCVVLLLSRGRLLRDLGASESARDRAEAQVLALAERIAAADARVTELSTEAGRLREHLTAVEREHAADRAHLEQLHAAKLAAVDEQSHAARAELEARLAALNKKFEDTFDALAARALSQASDRLLKAADEKFKAQTQLSAADMDQRTKAVDDLVRPIRESLARTDQKIDAMERRGSESFGRINEHLREVSDSGRVLREETSRLVRALREPQVRGRYGEVQLKRVAELAGMRAYCDFVEQDSTVDAEGNRLRPDMLITLPSGRHVAVDAKANLKPYLDALEASTPEETEERLAAFADGVADQAVKLSKKGYWSRYDGSAEFVVMFVPGDQFVDAALSKRPDLLEVAAERNVLLASPSSLIALLRAVAVGYQEKRLADDAKELRTLGRELHERASTAIAHLLDVGRALNKAVEKYNAFVGSYESRLQPVLRKFEDAGVKSGKDLPDLEHVARTARDAQPLLPDAQ